MGKVEYVDVHIEDAKILQITFEGDFLETFQRYIDRLNDGEAPGVTFDFGRAEVEALSKMLNHALAV